MLHVKMKTSVEVFKISRVDVFYLQRRRSQTRASYHLPPRLTATVHESDALDSCHGQIDTGHQILRRILQRPIWLNILVGNAAMSTLLRPRRTFILDTLRLSIQKLDTDSQFWLV